jgi:hypothetical protein
LPPAGYTFVVEHKAGHEQGASKEQIEQIQKPLAEQLAAQNALIANLTKALLQKNPATGPGAQQPVGAAVGLIAQGAAEGDSRLQKAFGLLKENNITEASQLLKAFAGDKEAQAEQAAQQAKQATQQAEKDRKEAALAYRNLGAIAGLANPKRALGLMRKPSRSIRTIWIARWGPVRSRSITATSMKRKPGLSACWGWRRRTIKHSINIGRLSASATSSNSGVTLPAR